MMAQPCRMHAVRYALVGLALAAALLSGWPGAALGADEPDAQEPDAQEPDAQEIDAASAIALGEQALESWGQRRYTLAYELFQRAEQKAHSPVFVLYMARCKRELDQLSAAMAHYRAVVEEELPAEAPPPWHEARREAERELAELKAATPSLRIVAPWLEAGDRITLDGRAVAAGGALEVDPGEHRVVIRRGALIVSDERVTLVEGEGLFVLQMALEPPPPRHPPPPPLRRVPQEGSEGSVVPGAVLMCLAGASAIAGAVTGGLALSRASDLKDRCIGTDCSAVRSLRDEAVTLAHTSTATLALAGGAALAGTLLLIFRPGGEPPSGARGLVPQALPDGFGLTF
jgi:hypothetical protein